MFPVAAAEGRLGSEESAGFKFYFLAKGVKSATLVELDSGLGG